MPSLAHSAVDIAAARVQHGELLVTALTPSLAQSVVNNAAVLIEHGERVGAVGCGVDAELGTECRQHL
jgi:hypothetical protein